MFFYRNLIFSFVAWKMLNADDATCLMPVWKIELHLDYYIFRFQFPLQALTSHIYLNSTVIHNDNMENWTMNLMHARKAMSNGIRMRLSMFLDLFSFFLFLLANCQWYY